MTDEAKFKKRVLKRLSKIENDLTEIKITQRKVLSLLEKEDELNEKVTFKSKRDRMRSNIRPPRFSG